MSEPTKRQRAQRRRTYCPFPGCVKSLDHPGDHKLRTGKLRHKSTRHSRIKGLSKKFEDFCRYMADSDNATQSAILVGFTGQYGRILVHRPEISQRIAKIREEYAQRKIVKRVEKALVTEEFVDQQLMHIIVHGQKKPYALKGCELAYKKLKLIEPEHGPRAYSFAGANAQAAGLGGATMEQVYKARWLREKEIAMAQQFEAEVQAQQKQIIEGTQV